MRANLFILFSLAATQAIAQAEFRDDICHRGQLGPDDLSQIQSVRVTNHSPLYIDGPVAHYGQLSPEDLSQMASVRPSATEPLSITGVAGCHRGQLSPEDLSYVVSVQPQFHEAGAPAGDTE